MALTGNTFFFPWEVDLMAWLQAHIGSTGISILSLFSALGEELMMVLVLGFLYWSWDKEMGKYAGLNVLVANVWNPLIKNIALRRRPYMDHESIRILRVVDPSADPMNIAAQGYSFPSGHSTCTVSLYGSVAAYLKKRWAWLVAGLLALLVGFSRVVVGAHYPTDVLVGWLLGLAAMVLVPWLQKVLRKRWLLYAVLLLTTVPGFFYCRSTDYFTSMGLLLGLMVSIPIEEKWVRFENTRSPVRMVLRVLGGAAVFFALNTLLKLPFPKAFLEGEGIAPLLVRCGRYFIVAVVDFAVYPLVFRWTGKIGKKA